MIDGWRVSDLAPTEWLRLRADLLVPGRLWLTFSLAPSGGGTPLSTEVAFAPSGLAGVAYGVGLGVGAPLVFGSTARGAVRAAAR